MALLNNEKTFWLPFGTSHELLRTLSDFPLEIQVKSMTDNERKRF